MALPTHPVLHRVILEITAEVKKPMSASEILAKVTKQLPLTRDDLDERTSTGASRIRANIGFGLSYLARAELLQRPERGQYEITDQGRTLLLGPETRLSFSRLSRLIAGERGIEQKPSMSEDDDDAPTEKMEKIIDSLESSLVKDIFDRTRKVPFDKFEKLVRDLLERMGYGKVVVTGRSHDEGIDVIAAQDALELERVYVQAKCWKGSVGGPEINRFVGSLDSHDAGKGIFVTTSSFTEPARRAAGRSKNYIIRLVDGRELARLMVKYNLGVTTGRVFEVKELDENYFSEER